MKHKSHFRSLISSQFLIGVPNATAVSNAQERLHTELIKQQLMISSGQSRSEKLRLQNYTVQTVTALFRQTIQALLELRYRPAFECRTWPLRSTLRMLTTAERLVRGTPDDLHMRHVLETVRARSANELRSKTKNELEILLSRVIRQSDRAEAIACDVTRAIVQWAKKFIELRTSASGRRQEKERNRLLSQLTGGLEPLSSDAALVGKLGRTIEQLMIYDLMLGDADRATLKLAEQFLNTRVVK